MNEGYIFTSTMANKQGYTYDGLGIWSSNDNYVIASCIDTINLYYIVTEVIDIDTSPIKKLAYIQRNLGYWDINLLNRLAEEADKIKTGFIVLWNSDNSAEIIEELITDIEEILNIKLQ